MLLKVLFCAFGSIGLQPMPLPSGFENQFAVAVIEVNATGNAPDAPTPQIDILEPNGTRHRTKRVVSVEVFDEPYERGEGNFAFYLNTSANGHTHPWDGTLPGGMIHLRVRVALDTHEMPSFPGARCRVTLGPSSVEAPIDGVWPT